MRVIRHPERTPAAFSRSVATLGNFDGVHIGHRRILDRVVTEAARRDAEPAAITFFPHPAVVLAPDRAPRPIASLAERLGYLREAGIDTVLLRRFTPEFSRIRAEAFVDRFLVGALRAEKVIVGHSVSFGWKREGTAELLDELGRRKGFEVETVGPVDVDGITVSSTRIREALAEGDVRLAARLLGRSYVIEGRVVVGDRRGQKLGFPTANVRPRAEPLVPDGVYAVTAAAGETAWNGVANVGRRPTFGGDPVRSVEAHLFGFDGDLYGRKLRVAFVERLRGEKRFPSVDALVEQIRNDVGRAREIFET